MKKLHLLFFSLLFSFLAFPEGASGQSLYDDVNTMLGAIDNLAKAEAMRATAVTSRSRADSLSQTPDSTGMNNNAAAAIRSSAGLFSQWADSLTLRSQAELVAILQNYNDPLNPDSIVVGTWAELKNSYTKNSLVASLLNDSMIVFPDTLSSSATSAAKRISQKIKEAPRQKIVRELHAEQAVSPADYLSVSKTMERYRTPVFPPMQALKISAGNTNRNVKNGILTSQAAIIEGIALFILDRAKDEVIINYLDRLVNEETPELRALFPTVVEEFGNTDFTYSNAFIARLRQAFYVDVQLLSVRFPVLLLEDDYFEPLQAEPIAYNLLALYSLISLGQFDMPVDESVPTTNRYLYQGFSEKTKEVNLLLAEKASGSAEYNQLISQATTVANQMKALYLALHDAEVAIGNSITTFQGQFPDAADPPLALDYLGESAFTLDVLFGETNEFGLNLLPQLLTGKLDSAYMLQYNTLESYDKFFGKERTAVQWRAAGLELSQNLHGTWYNESSIADIFRSWQSRLSDYQVATDRWMEESDPAGVFRRAQQKVEADREKLRQTVMEEKTFWETNGKPTYDQGLALNALANLLTPNVFQNIGFNVDMDALENPELMGQTEVIKLDRKKAHLMAVEERFITLDSALFAQHPKLFMASPLRKYLLDKQTTAPYAYLKAQIGDLENTLFSLDAQLNILEEKFAKNPSRARDNAKPVLQTTELVSNLMYCLRTGNTEQRWLTREQLDTMLDGGRREAAFLGLMQQRLGSTNSVGPLSADGLADLTKLTIKDIQQLPLPNLPDSIAVKDTMAFYRKAAFAVHTLNRVLELPLAVDPQRPGYFSPLKSRSRALEQIPEVSERALDFIYYVNIKDHGQAISSLIRLFSNLDLGIEEKEKELGTAETKKLAKAERKRKREIRKKMEGLAEKGIATNDLTYTKLRAELDSLKEDGGSQYAVVYLQKYGDFIAGLIDAREEEKVKELLEQIADPPGSSRIKRRSPLSVSLNAYLGGTYGREVWEGDVLPADEEFWTLAPTMPVGITLSKLFGRRETSFSAFISFLDVGSILTYQPTSVKSAETDFTLKNVFKPGVQLHWNIKKSPFYLGVGWQYGPHYVNVNGEQKSVGASRYFVGFGVDVPIKTLFQK